MHYNTRQPWVNLDCLVLWTLASNLQTHASHEFRDDSGLIFESRTRNKQPCDRDEVEVILKTYGFIISKDRVMQSMDTLLDSNGFRLQIGVEARLNGASAKMWFHLVLPSGQEYTLGLGAHESLYSGYEHLTAIKILRDNYSADQIKVYAVQGRDSSAIQDRDDDIPPLVRQNAMTHLNDDLPPLV